MLSLNCKLEKICQISYYSPEYLNLPMALLLGN
jgi:hypothetical protein